MVDPREALGAARQRVGPEAGDRIRVTRDSIEVPPTDPSGFSVGLSVRDGVYVVSFAGWQQRFERLSEAIHCFAFGLSSACRLRVEYRGDTPVRWRMEAQRDGDWVLDSETGPLLVPFWGARRIGVYQNRRAS